MTQGGWGRFLARTAVLVAALSGGVFVAVRQAMAVQGGATRNSLAFAGTLTGARSGEMVTLTFEFQREGASGGDAGAAGAVLCAPAVPTMVGSGGAVQVAIPLDGCPGTLFDGSDVVFRVRVNGSVVGDWRPVSPVPYARYADSVGTPDCPVGYERDGREASIVLCRRCRGPGRFENCYDDVVRVGLGASAFWIDRYEAGVDSRPDGTGTQLFYGPEDSTNGDLPRNGQWTTSRPPAYGLSRSGNYLAHWITWFQAQSACRASGKRLPTGEEWLEAARGTPDPSSPNNGVSPGNTQCNTMGTNWRDPGAGPSCRSRWGAEDMIGNVAEMTIEWDQGTSASTTSTVDDAAYTWGGAPEFSSDGLQRVSSQTYLGREGEAGIARRPAVGYRGGHRTMGTMAGMFSLLASDSPATSREYVGFRCVIPR